RLDELVRAMERLPAQALVYYEDAGFYHREMAATARARLLPRIDVYGMNEDELQEYVGRSVDLLDARDVSAALAQAHALIPVSALVVHTRFWAIAVGPDAGRYREALENAVLMSATRYRLGDSLVASDLEETAQLPRHRGGERLVATLERTRTDARGVAAVVADVASPTTIGLGDSFVGGFLSAFYLREGSG
ncbi:sugar/nucleoside kinase (ribokinase family), partial [Microbacterium endophyticum]|nr:sugar/nucleoside kinase (ribokinase family) [Microbacterium endophyticum]